MATQVQAGTFEFVRKFVYTEAGIVIEPGKEYLVEARLTPVARAAGLASVDALVANMRGAGARDLKRQVVDALTTNETMFFRDVAPFQMLEQTILPALIEARSKSRRLNVWYAASSTGQEPYSVSMLIRDKFPVLGTWVIDQLATDISRPALERARAARFSQLEVNRGLPAKDLVAHFRKNGSEWWLSDDIRQMVRFEELNLNGPWPSMPKLDIVFIRNVMIYFDVETKKRILDRIYSLLQPDGYLFLGAAETTFSLDERFRRSDVKGTGCYRPVPR